ncbi:MAG: hypothetical protein DRJ50_12550 [Actinobacteria bacterium]|nr:MAG: hypothetical protein DRJ50_12550 [Actinomycetota bacterium]
MGEKASTVGPALGLAAVMGLCCGLPLLLSAGVVATAAGIGLGSWIIIGLALVAVVIGAVRWRRNSNCEVPETEANSDLTSAP